jgi:hypothetical protein
MVVVRAGDHPGTITLTAKAHGLPAQTLKIRTVSNAQIMAQ